MADKPSQSLEKRAQRAMLQHAVLRWESAVVIALTLLLTVFGSNLVEFVPGWAWLVGGLIAEAALVYSSYTDQETGRKVVAEMLRHEFHPERLSDDNLQRQMEQALDYRSRITTAVRERNDSVLRDSLIETADQIDDWLESIYSLAQRLDHYRREKDVLDRDSKQAAERIRQLEKKALAENDPQVKQQIETAVAGMQRQIETIDALEKTMERARLQLETTMSSLGTIYSQTMLVGAKDIDSDRAKRLRQEIVDEVQELDDVLLAMDEVYASSAQI